MKILRGDVYWVDLDPTRGSEIKKSRPCIVVSNDIANFFSPLLTMVPITSKESKKPYPHEVNLHGIFFLKSGRAKANQIRTIDKSRVGKKIGKLPKKVVAKLDNALRVHLDLLNL